MKNTKKVGDISEAKVLAALLSAGKVVLIPFGDNQRYDLVIEDGGTFFRVQVKTGRLKSGSVRMSAGSVSGGKKSYYGNQVEFFGVYCPETDKCYLVPSEKIKTGIYLKVSSPVSSGRKITWAKDFEINGELTEPGNVSAC